MAEELGSLAVKIGLDSSGFQGGISNINKQMKVLDSEFKMNTSALGENGKGIDGLKVKHDYLTQAMEMQKQKISTLETAYNKSVETKGKDSKATQELEIKLNQAKTALNKMGTELNTTSTQLESAEKKTSLFAKAQEKLHLSMGELKEGFGAVGIAAGVYLKGAVDKAISAQKSTAQLTNLLQNQGISAQNAGQGIKDFTSAITKMSTFSGGEAKEALQTLTEKGISAGEALKMEGTLANVAAGSNMSLTDAANLMADAYHGKAKALVSLGILSKDEVKNLGNSEKATISMADVQDRLNRRFGGAAQTDLNSYAGKMKQMQNQLGAIKTQIGTALLPVLTILATKLADILKPVADFITKHPKVAAAILAAVAIIGTLVGGLSVLNTITGIFGITLNVAILPTIGIVVIAIAALGLVVYEVIKHWENITTFFSKLWKDLKSFFAKWGPDILLVVAPFIGIPLIIYKNFDKIKGWLSSIWGDVVGGVKGFVKNVGNVIGGIGGVIKNGFVSAIDFLKGLPAKALQWGKDFIEGFANGIKNTIHKVTSAITGLTDKIRANLHFSTPDEGNLKNYANWMPDFMSGLAQGIEANKYKVVNAIKDLSADMSVNVNPNAVNAKGNTINNTYGAILHTDNVTISNGMSIESLATELAFYMKQKQLGGSRA